MTLKQSIFGLISLIGILAGTLPGGELEESFREPPESTRPRCYWYWMDGCFSKDGITRDLEAMRRVGIGEAYIGIISEQSGTPQGEGVKALSDQWWGFIEHAVREGGRVGVDIGMFNSPGWSQSGGPWVEPQQAMRYVTLPEMRLRGPQKFEGKLPAPPGEFQDIAVLAFPVPTGEGQRAKETGRTPTEVKFEMSAPFTARSLTVKPEKKINVTAELQVSDDGRQYRTVKKFAIDRHNLKQNVGPVPLAPVVVSFPATTSRFFRLKFSGKCEPGEIILSPAARVENIAEKSLAKVFQDPLPPFDFYSWPRQAEPESANLTVRPDAVRDISRLMGADGTLRWDVPDGEWIVLRTAMAPTGTENSPAPPEATGLEVDKMNRAALKTHFDAYIGHLLKRMPAADRKAWKHVVADSYEMGPQNWTDGFAKEFRKQYGYDPFQWLPVLTGRIVGSAEESNRFLWDLRRLVAERVARDYVGGLRDLCRQHGLKMWLENYGHWGFPSEFLLYGGYCDEIGGEFWSTGNLGSVELRDASSAAHIYGMPVVWAEAFTGGPAFVNSPRDLKARGDWAFCEGINQFVFHVNIHQPDEKKRPGVNAWFGTEFNRLNTWFEYSKTWIDYLRRCSVMLQAGKPVADVAYFIGEDAPKMAGIRRPELPPGYDFDYINSDVLLHRAKVQDGRLVLPDGVSYRILVLPPLNTMRPDVMKQIAAFAAAGLQVVGPAPKRSPSLKNFPECDEQVRRLAAQTPLRAKFDLPPPDVVCPGDILWKHRRSDDTDIYFLSNQKAQTRSETISFRVDDRAPEFWCPKSGRTEIPAVYDTGEGTVRVPIHFEPHGSVFVVFRQPAEKDRIVSVTCNGKTLLDTKPPRIAKMRSREGTFSLSLWVKPGDDTTLLPEANSGVSGMGDKRNDVIFPEHGNKFDSTGGHAGSGLAVGRNGVCVFEHGASYFAPVLVHPSQLNQWTHVAVVYRDGQPHLYLNGKFVHKGLKSNFVVHPSAKGEGGVSKSFRGQKAAVRFFDRAVTDGEIAKMAESKPNRGAPSGPAIAITRNADGKIETRANRPGNYEIQYADGRRQMIEVASVPAPLEISGPWEVSFNPEMGGPAKVTFEKLVDWTWRPEPGIKYYSGPATYRTVFQVSDPQATVVLDLDEVHAIAEVRVNGQPVGTLWKQPYTVDISDAVKRGTNKLEVTVVNTWLNRLLGDEQPGVKNRLTSTTLKTWKAKTPLQPAGLLGPVRLLQRK